MDVLILTPAQDGSPLISLFYRHPLCKVLHNQQQEVAVFLQVTQVWLTHNKEFLHKLFQNNPDQYENEF